MAETLQKPLNVSAEAGRDRLPRAAARATPAPTFEQLVAEQQDRVRRLCFRLLGWQADIEDIVQDVFLSVFRAMPQYRGTGKASTWVTRIAINACRSHMRKRASWLRLLKGVREERPRQTAAADEAVAAAERFARVRGAVQRLPVKYREVVVLRYLEEMPVAEIATVLGLSPNAVGVRLNRARRWLKDGLGALAEGWNDER
jgi:RNA polymerase sigma-70 factor (ECF subfamily)